MVTALQKQISVPKASALSFPPTRVARPRLAHSAQSLNDTSPLWVRQQVILDGTQHILGIVTRQLP